MIKDIEVKLTAQEVQAIITALKNVPYGKCNFKGKEELIEKLKGKSNTMYRNKYNVEDFMKKLTSEEVLNLIFGTKIKIVYHNSKYHDKNETYNAIVYGDKIGYEDGMTDHIRTIAEQVFNNQCNVYKI